MRNRHQVGAGIAALPLAIGIGWQQGWHAVSWALFGVAVLILILFFADLLPGLHKLPLIGSHPPPKVIFLLPDHQRAMAFRFPRGAGPAEVTLEVGFENRHRDYITRTNLNLIVPGNVEIVRCTQGGARLSNAQGQVLWTDVDELGLGSRCKYYAWGMDISPDATLVYFKLTAPEPGKYPLKLKLRSPDLYEVRDKVYEDTLTVLPPGPSV